MISCNNSEPSQPPASEVETEEADNAWTVARAAEYLGLGTSTLYKKAAAGLVPSFKVFGALRFSPKALAEWRNAQQHGAER